MIPSRLLLGIVLISFAAATAAKPIITQYWPSYNYVAEPLSDFPWYSTDIGYYFVVVTTAAGFNEVAENLPNVADFAPAAHANGKKAIFSIGGWDGGLYFSGQVNTTAGRTRLATQLHTFATKYAFDGVDIDWEYPGSQGIGCNEISPNDSANFLLFLKQLRTTFGATAILTAAVGTNTFVGPDGNPLASVASYAKYLSYVNLMTYDIGGIWDPHTDPNSPLRTCLADSSATAAVGAWVAAGFPASQILLGIPSYSHSFTTLSSTLQATEVLGYKSYLYQKMSSITPKGDHTDVYVPATDLDVCGNTQTGYDGQWLYKNLIADGVLSSDGSTGLNGYARTWDGCTGTPFLFNSKSREFISYDDAESAGYKAALAKADGLAGVMVFDSTGFNTQVYQSIQTNLGLATTAPPAKRSFEIIARNEHAKTPSLCPHLPNEILTLIIGHIPLACGYSEGHGAQGSQWKGLARLCLVAASFLEPSRKLLYWRLDVPSQTSQDSPSRSAAAKEAQVAVVKETPHLASLVRTITASRPTSEDLLKTLLATTHRLNVIFLWGNSDSVAPSLLATSPHLTSLSLTSSDDFLVWDLLRSQTSLKSLSIKVTLGVPSGPPPTFELKELELNFFSAGPRAASNAAYLAFATQSLTMSMTTLEFCMGKDAEIVYDLAPFARLESLHIHIYSQPLPLNLPETIRPLSLLRLTLDRNIFDSPLFSPILAALPPTSPRSSRLPRPNPSLTS